MKKFTVHCDCPTPLAENPFSVEAETSESAIEKFFERNGISKTAHKITVNEAEGVKADELIEENLIVDYLAENPDATNKEVITALKEKGLEVSSPQVTSIKKLLNDLKIETVSESQDADTELEDT